ncbi:MAG: EAL domain-containing protein [Gammaproteobacteria bacterium]
MDTDLKRIQRRLSVVPTLSVAVAPLAGYGIAVLFGMLEPRILLADPAGALLPAIYLALVAWAWLHFRRFLQPIVAWADRASSEVRALPPELNERLCGFSGSYWSFFLIYILVLPTVQHWAGAVEPGTARADSLLNFILLQLVIAIFVGLPGYLHSLDLIGRLSRHVGLATVQVSMKSKLLLVGGYVPLLTTTLLLKYYWWRTGFLHPETFMVWTLLGLIAFTITVMSIRSLDQALAPVAQVIDGRGGSSYTDLAKRLRPQSTDEIGYLIQTLGRLFRRLGEQESHVQAGVDAAAEGIVVVDAQGRLESFNPAAERLFGYGADEMRGRPLSWLLPSLVTQEGGPRVTDSEQEVEGRHCSGRPVPMSVRVSRMRMDERTLYACLVADISERKATEQKLVEAEARYRDLVETAHDLVWSVDMEGRWTYLNNASRDIYGYAPEQMLGRYFTEFQAPEAAARDAAALTNILAGRELVHYETLHLDAEGRPRHLSFNAKPLCDEHGKVLHISGTARDITEQKAFERELTYQAQHDTLTGLYNRHYFQIELERVVSRVMRSGAEGALVYLDLDQFKYINDTLGHAAGDRLLLDCTELLRGHTRNSDLLARFGGDEFTLLLHDIDSDRAQRVAEHLREIVESYRFLEDGKTFNITCSIGLSIINSAVLSADDALAQADLACNLAKSRGRNRVHVYDPKDRNKDGMAEDMGWAVRVREAFETDRFQLVYQPIVSVADGKVHDYEVLLRMALDNGELILPGGFMPAAERFGLVHSVDRWAVRNAIEYLTELHAGDQPVHFAINLSGRAFEDRELLPLISASLRESGLEPSALTFEITETAAIANLSAAMTFIGKLKDMGCQFALDDFGSGFCSFTYLKHLPVDKLKIDGSFVQGLAHTSVDQAMVQSMNQIAHALGKVTIAEFVQDETTLDLLRSYGVDFAQGHYVGRPRTCLKRPLLHGVPNDDHDSAAGLGQGA